MTRTLIIASAIALAACAGAQPEPRAPQPQVQTYARSVVNSLQPQSFANQREYCGYIYLTPNDTLAHTTRAGDLSSCDYGRAPSGTIASFHTHGHYAPGYDSEIPSVDDATGSIDSGLDDYLGTPGGRFWIIGADGRSDLICDAGCLQSDPNYRDDPSLPVDNAYTLGELRALQS